MVRVFVLPVLVAAAFAQDPASPLAPVAADRRWEVLRRPQEGLREAYRRAGQALGEWTISLAGVAVDGPTLARLADTAPDEPFVRVLREGLGLPVDPVDLLYLLDDVLVAGESGRRGEAFHLTTGRARTAGVLVHPEDIWFEKPRIYPHGDLIMVDEPLAQESFPPAADGDPLGPGWTMRYRSPTERDELFRTLGERRPDATFSSRVAALVAQLEQQGARVYLSSFLRYPERGYLMWGAYELRRAEGERAVHAALKKLGTANKKWAHVPIVWTSPEGWKATQEAARRMADAFDVAYATEWGARYSNHYDGTAVDFSALALPRTLELHAPDGASQVFDLSGADQPRDLSLTPEIVRWVEEHFRLDKLEDDHPHWDDLDVDDLDVDDVEEDTRQVSPRTAPAARGAATRRRGAEPGEQQGAGGSRAR